VLGVTDACSYSGNIMTAIACDPDDLRHQKSKQCCISALKVLHVGVGTLLGQYLPPARPSQQLPNATVLYVTLLLCTVV
jgi:hypothetical protein